MSDEERDIRLLLDAFDRICADYGGEYGHGGGADWALGYGVTDEAAAQLGAYERLRERYPAGGNE